MSGSCVAVRGNKWRDANKLPKLGLNPTATTSRSDAASSDSLSITESTEDAKVDPIVYVSLLGNPMHLVQLI